MSKEFQGKHGRWLTAGPEEALKRVLVPRVPSWCETHHLTLTTLLWSAGVVGFSALAAGDVRWLWGASVCIALQYVTDLLDVRRLLGQPVRELSLGERMKMELIAALLHPCAGAALDHRTKEKPRITRLYSNHDQDRPAAALRLAADRSLRSLRPIDRRA